MNTRKSRNHAGYGILSSFRMGTAAPGDGGGAGHDEGSTFMHYAGPVFPLTTAENANGITAERDITLDFAAYGAENYADSITVTDTYTLTNMTDADITLIAAYPTAGTLLENPEVELSADGEVVAVDFVPGAPLEAMFAESWADYAADLGGAYLAHAQQVHRQRVTERAVFSVRLRDGPLFAPPVQLDDIGVLHP